MANHPFIIGIAANAFKGSLDAVAATHAIAEGLAQSRLACEIRQLPLADGGDGTLDVMLTQPGAQRYRELVEDPLGEPVLAEYGILADGQTAVIEMALASGLSLLSNRRDALRSSTYGTGQLIADALKRGAKRIILGVGGSATTDGGAGCLQALGFHLLDANGDPLPPGGGALHQLARLEKLSDYQDIEFLILCDVDNPPIGDQGAARIFAPQKGASPEQVEILEQNLTHYFTLIAEQTGRDVRTLPGGGAAGAIGGGLAALLNARLVPGAATLIDFLGYEAQIAGCHLILTGEGQLDHQTEHGKAPAVVAQLAAKYGIPTVALAGSIPTEPIVNTAIAAAFSLVPRPASLEEAMQQGGAWLTNLARQIGNLIAAVR